MEQSNNIKKIFDILLTKNNAVFIVPHTRVDMDALASSIGIALICKKCKKKCYIVIDDDIEKIDNGTRVVLGKIKNYINIITASDVPSTITNRSLMVAVDTNKEYLISTKPFLNEFNDIIVIDHHKVDKDTIKTEYIFTNPALSSTSEEISRLLALYNVKISPFEATIIYAGICLDTANFTKNINHSTHDEGSRLLKKGADPVEANSLVSEEDYERDRAIQKLVDNTEFPTFTFAIAADESDTGRIYDIEDIAKAADYLLKYRVTATFAIAKIDEDTVSISARSKGIIDAESYMKYFGGGGNSISAAARIKNISVHEVKENLKTLLTPGYILFENEMDLEFDPNNIPYQRKLK